MGIEIVIMHGLATHHWAWDNTAFRFQDLDRDHSLVPDAFVDLPAIVSK